MEQKITVRGDLNGWVSEDEDGAQEYYIDKPEMSESFWNSKSTLPVAINKRLHNRLDLGNEWTKSLRQVINGVVQEPRPELKVDDRVLVWDRPGEKCRRHFKEWADDGRIVCFGLGRTSWSTETDGIHWSNWKLPEGDK